MMMIAYKYLPYIASSVELEGKAVGFVSSRSYKNIWVKIRDRMWQLMVIQNNHRVVSEWVSMWVSEWVGEWVSDYKLLYDYTTLLLCWLSTLSSSSL